MLHYKGETLNTQVNLEENLDNLIAIIICYMCRTFNHQNCTILVYLTINNYMLYACVITQ